MQTWAKRGLQTALVTGGLLVLGTGIASAQEDVNPDRPANPLDGSLSVPLDIQDNAISTPLGQLDLPAVHQTISSDQITGKLPKPLAGPAGKVVGSLSKTAGPATDTISGLTDQVTSVVSGAKPLNGVNGPLSGPLTGRHAAGTQAGLDNPARGNKVHNHLAVPVQVAGNALALGHPAKVHTNANQSFSRPAPESTGANGQSLGGNVLGLDGALPVQLANNAIGLGANAESKGVAKQSTNVGGPVNTDGSGTSLAGNVLLGHLATPIQVTGNAVAGGGKATTDSTAQSSAKAGGAIKTSGRNGALSGNIGAIPAALPIELNGGALSGLGQANAASRSKAFAQAGDRNKDSIGTPFYTLTNGDPAALSGNILQPEVAGPAMLNGLAGSLLGRSASVGSTENKVQSGGGAGSSGRDSSLSGNIANLPVALPGQVFGDAAAVGGKARSWHKNKVDSRAGGSNNTFGDGSHLSSNDIVPTVAGSGDIFGSGLSVLGNASGKAKNQTKSHSGGYVGTTGNDSQGSGNIGHLPIALPVQAFGLGGSAIGNASGDAKNKKDIRSGGSPDTNDDNGVVSSNLAFVPASLPVELFGDSVAAAAHANGRAHSELTSKAGGNATATGKVGTIAGNILQAPLSAPLQGFGTALGLAGHSNAAGKNVTDSTAGGDAKSDGTRGTLAGNVATLTGGGAGQLFGDTVGVLGNLSGVGDNDTTSTAGGDVTTAGDNGAGSGNVLSGQLLPVLQAFGDGVSVLANGRAAGSNNTAAGAGGDVTTSGVGGSLSGNLLDVPAALVGQAFGDGVGILGNQEATGENNLVGVVGGNATTKGDNNSLSGLGGQLPLGFVGQVYNVPVEILGNVITSASNASSVTVANKPAQFDYPVDGNGLPVDGLPQLPELPGLPGGLPGLAPLPGLGGGQPGLSGLGGGAQALHTQSAKPISAPVEPISAVSGTLPGLGGAGLPELPQLPGLGGASLPQGPELGNSTHSLDSQPALGGDSLPSLPGVADGNLPALSMLDGQTGALPTGLPGLSGV